MAVAVVSKYPSERESWGGFSICEAEAEANGVCACWRMSL